MDTYLKSYIDKYDDWLDKGLIEQSSRVIPVRESLDAEKQILLSDQVLEILKNADLITLARCICRDREKNCDKPMEVCFILNRIGEKYLEKGLARKIEFEEVEPVLKLANKSGLVHMTLFRPDHEIFALCSCCSCCCHDLQLLLQYGKEYITAKSDYIAVDDSKACIHCGECIDRCPFGARAFRDEIMIYTAEKCYGCGLCITTCPKEAITMGKR